MANVYSVSSVNRYIRNMISEDFLLSALSVQGEVSNCKYHGSGHIYFTLKDENSALKCVMFAGSRAGLDFRMQDGDRIIATGNIDVYEKSGTYQLYAKKIVKAGIGALYEEFMKRKAELEERGMFDAGYKKPLPQYPRTVGIVTAATGAAIHDIQNIAKRRNPGIQLILYPALVQGEQAKESIARGIEVLDRAGVDVIIVGRGGGSIEDLWAFNEETVAYAIFNAQTPVISAVGHETDFTIADFVADLRAPTPSAAAELAVPDVMTIIDTLEDYGKRLRLMMSAKISNGKLVLEKYAKRLALLDPGTSFAKQKEALQRIRLRMQSRLKTALESAKNRLAVSAARLEGLSPSRKLAQGFSFLTGSDGQPIHSVASVKQGDALAIHVTDGILNAAVTSIDRDRRYYGG